MIYLEFQGFRSCVTEIHDTMTLRSSGSWMGDVVHQKNAPPCPSMLFLVALQSHASLCQSCSVYVAEQSDSHNPHEGARACMQVQALFLSIASGWTHPQSAIA